MKLTEKEKQEILEAEKIVSELNNITTSILMARKEETRSFVFATNSKAIIQFFKSLYGKQAISDIMNEPDESMYSILNGCLTIEFPISHYRWIDNTDKYFKENKWGIKYRKEVNGAVTLLCNNMSIRVNNLALSIDNIDGEEFHSLLMNNQSKIN